MCIVHPGPDHDAAILTVHLYRSVPIRPPAADLDLSAGAGRCPASAARHLAIRAARAASCCGHARPPTALTPPRTISGRPDDLPPGPVSPAVREVAATCGGRVRHDCWWYKPAAVLFFAGVREQKAAVGLDAMEIVYLAVDIEQIAICGCDFG